MQVQADNVANRVDKQGIFGELERLGAVGLQRKRLPNPRDGRLAQTFLLRQGPRAPVRRIARGRLQRRGDHALDPRIGDFAGRPRPRFVQQSGEAGIGEALAPFAHRLQRHTEVGGDRPMGRAARAPQDDPGPQGQRLGRRGPSRILFQRQPLRRAQHDSRNGAPASHMVSSSLYTTYDFGRRLFTNF